jgi:tetratricopeptide (TPR) repeat protein
MEGMTSFFSFRTVRLGKLVFFLLLFTNAISAKSKEVLAGEKAYSRGSFDSARDHFEQAIENGDETGDPRLYIGLILESRRQYAESISYFRAAAERPMQKKFTKVAYWKMVILCRQAKLYAESLRYVDRLQEMGEKSEIFEKIRYEAENYQGKKDFKGYANIKRAVALENELQERREKGEDAEDLSDVMHSIIAAYQQAISEDARWKEYRWKIAQYHEKLKEMREAQNIYRLIWEESGDASAAYKLGYFARRSGDYAGSLKYFASALEKSIEDPQLKFYIRLNAAQAHYGLGHYSESFAHAKIGKRLAVDLELTKKTVQSLRRIYCLGSLSTGELNEDYCRFDKKAESTVFLNLIAMKRALAEKKGDKAATFATKIYEKEIVEGDETEAALPAYAMSDLPVAIGVLFKGEKYRAVINLTDRFRKNLEKLNDFSGWRAVSFFALKEYGSALIEFDKVKNPTPSQMNLHLMTMAHVGDWAGIRSKGAIYLKNPKAHTKLESNFRKLKLYTPLRQEKDFETWLNPTSAPPIDSKNP